MSPHAQAMPSTVSSDFTGRRSTCRRIIRVGAANHRCSPMRSARVARYTVGVSGRMPSAGASRAARKTETSVPLTAAAARIASAISATPGRTRKSR